MICIINLDPPNPAQIQHVTNIKTESRITEYDTRLHTVSWASDDGQVAPETCRVLLSIKSINSRISLVTYMIIIYKDARSHEHKIHFVLYHISTQFHTPPPDSRTYAVISYRFHCEIWGFYGGEAV